MRNLPRKGSQEVRTLRPPVNRVRGTERSNRADTPAATLEIKPDDAPTERGWIRFRSLVVFNVISVDGEALADWVHALSHCTGQASRLQRGLRGRLVAKTGAREVLAAELGSVLLEHQLGIDSASENQSTDLGQCLEGPKEKPQKLDGCSGGKVLA